MQSGIGRATDIQSQANALEERLINYAVRIVKLSASLPKTAAGRHIAGQILRSGTSPGPNYGEARGAESHADFIHKMRIVLKELNETSIWLRVIERSELIKSKLLPTSLVKLMNCADSLRPLSKLRRQENQSTNDKCPMTNDK